jgi:predicted acetyltransferase
MALEIRAYREEEHDAFRRVPGIVFGNVERQLPPVDQDFNIPPEWSLCAFEDGELATTYAAYPFIMRLNGGKAPAAGVTMVGTLPWFRRRGHLRKIMETDFQRRYEQRMEPLAVLLASMAAIYQRYGYAVVSSRYWYSIEPRWINLVPSLPPTRGDWREASPDELPLLQSLYRDFSAPRNGYLHRAPVIWDRQVLGRGPAGGGPDLGPALISVYEEDGQPQGYITFSPRSVDTAWDGGPPGHRVFVRDYAYKTPQAYQAIWEMLKRFDLPVRVVFNAAPTDDPAFDILLDPRELHATRGDWLLARIIDLERVLPLRPYGAEGRVVFDVRDAICPWNAGRWALEAGGEGSAVQRTKDAPQLSLDISALAQILFGQVSPTQCVRIGRAEPSRDAPLALWDAMWRTNYAPFCPDGF